MENAFEGNFHLHWTLSWKSYLSPRATGLVNDGSLVGVICIDRQARIFDMGVQLDVLGAVDHIVLDGRDAHLNQCLPRADGHVAIHHILPLT